MAAEDESMDFFDFGLDDFLGNSKSEPAKNSKEQSSASTNSALLNSENEAITSYLLVNALLNLLIAKGIIYPHEVNALISELYVEYRTHRESGENGDRD